VVSHQVIVNLIAATTTKTELRVQAEIDPGKHPKGVKASDDEVASIRIEPDKFHGEWNYTILTARHLNVLFMALRRNW